MAFIQIIEYRTTRPDEIAALMDGWTSDAANVGTAVRSVATRDRDGDGTTYVHMVEFPSYEAAMENSNRPETSAFAEQMMKLCEGPATFRNLDVVREYP
ncbi:MAG TPA: hypothetical protein VFA94_00415 [Acidimicrobiales bacterium]|nr:hypothetical protein [Acidimicrobiales bacterium]